jgi:hypothetical protein
MDPADQAACATAVRSQPAGGPIGTIRRLIIGWSFQQRRLT